MRVAFVASLPDGVRVGRAPSPAMAQDSTAAGSDAVGSETGRTTYQSFCTTCHGTDGKGDAPAAAGLEPPPRNFASGEFVLPEGIDVAGLWSRG